MLSVATVGGHRVPLPAERELMLSVQRHVLHASVDVDGLAAVRASEVAEAVHDPERRLRLVHCALLVPYVSLEANLAKVAVVDALAIQLGVTPQTLHELHRARAAQLRRLVLDHARRGARLFLTVHTSAQMRSVVEALRRSSPDEALAERYRALRALDAGTLGRALYDFHRAHGFALPGEPGAIDETLVRYDVLRLLAGYDVGAGGDAALAGFAAGVAAVPCGHRVLLELLAEVHAGAQMRGPGAVNGGGPRFDVASCLAAYERGRAASAQLGGGWDWWSVAAEDVGTLRRRYGIRGTQPDRPARLREGEVRRGRQPRAA